MGEDTRSKSLKRWGLKHNPFVTLPPDKEKIQQVFTGRQKEINTLTSLVTPAQGIFLVGLFGVGKSILALEALRRMTLVGNITVYCKYDKQEGFSKSVLKKMVQECTLLDPKGVYEILVRGRGLNAIGNPQSSEIYDALHRVNSVMDAIEGIAKLISSAGIALVIVVDDLDKGTDIGNIHDIVQDTRLLIEWGCAVILLGHHVGPTAGFSSSADILFPLALKPLAESELIEMMEKYLNLERERDEEDPTYPFTSKAAHIIAKSITEFELTPRIFNFACKLLLEKAAQFDADIIDEQFVVNNWAEIAEMHLVKSLQEEDRRYLEIIYKNGVLSEDTREPIKEIGGPFAEYGEVRNILAKLFQDNILIEHENDGKREIKGNPMIEQKKIFFIR